jgi:hypothetical protein
MLTEEEAILWRRMFDYWRDNYGCLPYIAHQRFYNMVSETFPTQDKANRPLVEEALTQALVMHGHPLGVWELGGWDGALARDMIEACGDGIAYWINIEICSSVVQKAWRDHSLMDRLVMNYGHTWPWDDPQCSGIGTPAPGIAILSHVIEHLSWAHLQACFGMLRDVPLLYIQTPEALGQGPHPTGWRGTLSTHKLEVGLGTVDEYLKQSGYTLLWRKCNAALYAHD